jgi:hypothetical protein
MSRQRRQPRTPPRQRKRDSLGFEDPRDFFSPMTPSSKKGTPRSLIRQFLDATPSPQSPTRRSGGGSQTPRSLIQQYLLSTPNSTPRRKSAGKKVQQPSIAIGNLCSHLGRLATTRRKNKVQCQLTWKKIN